MSIDVPECRRLERIEVEHRPVRLIGRVDARVPRMQVDDARVGDPRERRHLVDHDVRLGLLTVIRPRLDPCRGMRRFVLAPERLSVDAVGEHLHRQRTIAQVRQHVRRHPDVVLDHVALGDAVGGPQHLVEIRERKSAAGDFPMRIALQRSQRGQSLAALSLRVLSRWGALATLSPRHPEVATSGAGVVTCALRSSGGWPQPPPLEAGAFRPAPVFRNDFSDACLRGVGRGGGCGRRGGGGCRRASSRRSGLRRPARV